MVVSPTGTSQRRDQGKKLLKELTDDPLSKLILPLLIPFSVLSKGGNMFF